MNEEEVYIGIDPSVSRKKCGYAVIQGDKCLAYGVFVAAAKELHYEHGRLYLLKRALARLIKQYKPASIAYEDSFQQLYKNGQRIHNADKLRLMQAIVICNAFDHGIPYRWYTATQVKKAVGKGNASKPYVRRMVCAIFGIDKPSSMPLDASDALAVAYCHQQAMLASMVGASR